MAVTWRAYKLHKRVEKRLDNYNLITMPLDFCNLIHYNMVLFITFERSVLNWVI